MDTRKASDRPDVCRSVRLPRDLDRQLDLLIEQRGSTRCREMRKALVAHIALHA